MLAIAGTSTLDGTGPFDAVRVLGTSSPTATGPSATRPALLTELACRLASDPGGAANLTVLRAARAITPFGERAVTLEIADGRIVTLDSQKSPDVELAPDEVLLPGLVDTHVHVNEPGRTAWEGFATATRAAARGGVTTVLDMPLNSIPPTCDVAALQAKRDAADGLCAVDVGFWGGAIPGNVADLEPLHHAGVFGFKCFLLPSGVDEFPPLDAAGLRDAMAAIASFDGLLIAHCEDETHVTDAPNSRDYQGFLDSRPPNAEQSRHRPAARHRA